MGIDFYQAGQRKLYYVYNSNYGGKQETELIEQEYLDKKKYEISEC